MKSAFALGLLAASAAASIPANGASAVEVIELIDGVLIGALDTEHVENLDTCVREFNPLVMHMVDAINDFEEGSFHAISEGIYELGQFISQVGIIMSDCAQVGAEDAEKLKEMGEAFLHPKQLIINAEHNVILNGVEILKDVRKAGKDL